MNATHVLISHAKQGRSFLFKSLRLKVDTGHVQQAAGHHRSSPPTPVASKLPSTSAKYITYSCCTCQQQQFWGILLRMLQNMKNTFRLTTERPERTIPEDSTCLSGSSIAPLHPSSSSPSSSSVVNSSSAQPQCAFLDLLLNVNSVNSSPPVTVTSENFLHNNHTNIPLLGLSESWLKNYKIRPIKTGCVTILYIHQNSYL